MARVKSSPACCNISRITHKKGSVSEWAHSAGWIGTSWKTLAFPQQLHGDWQKCEVIWAVNAISSLFAHLKAAWPECTRFPLSNCSWRTSVQIYMSLWSRHRGARHRKLRVKQSFCAACPFSREEKWESFDLKKPLILFPVSTGEVWVYTWIPWWNRASGIESVQSALNEIIICSYFTPTSIFLFVSFLKESDQKRDTKNPPPLMKHDI